MLNFKKSAYRIKYTRKSWLCGNNINVLREKRLSLNQSDTKDCLWVVGLQVIFAFLSTYIYIFNFFLNKGCVLLL